MYDLKIGNYILHANLFAYYVTVFCKCARNISTKCFTHYNVIPNLNV